ncbi:MAG: hypothetical protein ACOCWJ_02255 [Verrucomicrobiota bacterium]
MIGISEWYTKLGELSFPTVFIVIDEGQKRSLIEQDDASAAKHLSARLQKAVKSVFGTGFVGTDLCAPTDSPRYRPGKWITFGRTAWRLLAESDKVRAVLQNDQTNLLVVRPYRRMDKAREFRVFVHQRKPVAISQYHLDRHLPGIIKREREIITKTHKLIGQIADRLPAENIVVDIYITSDGEIMLVDMNTWGGDTDPLLLRTWERDWTSDAGLVLVPEPIKMKGDISVSF